MCEQQAGRENRKRGRVDWESVLFFPNSSSDSSGSREGKEQMLYFQGAFD